MHAMAYVPVILAQLDDDGKRMFGEVMQAMFDIGLRAGEDDHNQDGRLDVAEFNQGENVP